MLSYSGGRSSKTGKSIVTAWASHGEVGFCRTATVVVRIFSRITRDDLGFVFFSPYSAA